MRLVLSAFFGALFLAGCPLPILSRNTIIDPDPPPVCKIEKLPEYKVPAPGALDGGAVATAAKP